MSRVRVLSHPIWTGVGALVAIIALFWSSGIGREVDRLAHFVSPTKGQSSKPSPENSKANDTKSGLSTTRRLALLIANSKYGSVGTLKNPRNDIERVGKALKSKGFETIKRYDLDHAGLRNAIANFEGLLKAGGVGLIYYSGHALYRDGHDILLPIDIAASVKSQLSSDSRGFVSLTGRSNQPRKVPYAAPKVKGRINGAVYLSELLKPIDVIIDGRRNDSGSAVIYSASRGQIAMDSAHNDPDLSPFAKAFDRVLNTGDLELFDAFRNISKLVPIYSNWQQTPTVEATISSEFYFDRPWRDDEIGLLKIVIIDSCRTDLDLASIGR